MTDPIYNLEDATEGERIKAPTRKQISEICNLGYLWEMISYAEDQVISISTILEYFKDDFVLKGSRVAALIFWKQASKNLKNRVNQLQAEKKILEKQKEENV